MKLLNPIKILIISYSSSTEASGEVQRDVQRVCGARSSGADRGIGARVHDPAAGARGRHEGVLGLLPAAGLHSHRVCVCEVRPQEFTKNWCQMVKNILQI